MGTRVRGHVRQNVIGYLALFVALTMGTAYATHPGGANTISTVDLQSQAVTGGKLAPQAVTSGKIADAEIKTPKIRDLAVTTPKIGGKAVTTSRLADGAVSEAKLAADALSSRFVANRSLGSCFADSGPVTCASTSLNLARPSRVAVDVVANWRVHGFGGDEGENQTPDEAKGACQITLDGVARPNTEAWVGEVRTAVGAIPWSRGGAQDQYLGTMALNDLTGTLAAGQHSFGVHCNDFDSDVDWNKVTVRAIALGG